MDSKSPVLSGSSSTRPEDRNKRPSIVAAMSTMSLRKSSNATEALKSPTIEDSPLTLQMRPDVFEPKVVGLYKDLFRNVEDDEKPEGFWRELFLLKPDVTCLRSMLEDIDADFLLHIPHHSQQLVVEATAHIKAGQAPADENALETLTVFFAVVLAKKYTNPSSDIIEVLAGLDRVDAVFTELVAVLDHAIKDGRTLEYRQNAVRTAIAIVAGGYHTALLSYFINIDLFPALMKLVHQLDHALQASEPFLLAGLLANYNKFEVHNQYRVRFADFVNEDTMHKVIDSVGWTCTLLRDKYIAVQDDTPAGWSIVGTLSYVGLGALAGAKPAPPVLTEDQQRELFATQPGHEAASLLSLYDFTVANNLFSQRFIIQPSPSKTSPTPFAAFLSFTSYLHHHAYRTHRSTHYAHLTTLILLVLTSAPQTLTLLTTTTAPVRLCRQRAPYLPLPRNPATRPYTTTILDLLTDALNHNLRKSLDITLYTHTLLLLNRLLTHLSKTRTKLPAYHWPELWRSLLAFIRFLNTYPDDLHKLPGIEDVVRKLVDVIALALTQGEGFLEKDGDFDDLLYKVVESGEALEKLKTVYGNFLARSEGLAVVLKVRGHFGGLLEQKAGEGKKVGSLSPVDVGKVIKGGYESLDLEWVREGQGIGGEVAGFREGEFRGLVKRVTKAVVRDAGAFVA